MKIIHTSDWHIGKIVNEFSMIEDQKYILNKLIKLIEEEKPNALIIAGDIYDRSIPPVEAVELLNETLSTLIIDHKVKVLAISGNHDSGERLSFGSKILERQGLYIAGSDDEIYRAVVVEENGEKFNFYLVPYKDPALIKRLLDNKEIKSHNDAMIAIIDKIKENLNKDEFNVLVGHGYMTTRREDAVESIEDKYTIAELEVSESERPLSIGGTDLIDANIFEDFDYVALGHLHGRQKIGREEMRYSGTPLKYSFSEVNHKKGVTLVNLQKDESVNNKTVNIELKELKPLRDLRIIKGNIEDIVEEGRQLTEGREDYIQAILTDDGELMNPMEKLRAVYPNTMLISREKKREYSEDKTSAKGEYKSKSKVELFKEFYEGLGGGEYTPQKEAVIIDTINEVLKKEVE
ncbi:MAG: exonuclease SbcCD subunit D [Fusobacteriaceae bacterium]